MTKKARERVPVARRPATAQKWPQTLWVVRHGQSAGNVARDAAEQRGLPDIVIAERDVDVPLSALGHRQAEALGEWFAEMPAGKRPQVVLCSPYLRARQTADHVLAVLATARGKAPAPERKIDERLREKEFGILDRLTRTGVRAKFPELAEQLTHVKTKVAATPIAETRETQEAGQATPASAFAPTDAVSVPRYGRGVVDSIDAVGITVVFAGDLRRMFLAAFVRPAASMSPKRSRPVSTTPS